MSKLITVIIPTFKPEEYLLKLFKDLRNQTLSSYKFQVIVILNGVKDPYYEMLADEIKMDSNIELFYTSIKGVSSARNFGLNKADGKYIIFIDDDDSISENYLESLLTTAELTNCQIVQSNFKAITKKGLEDDYISKAYKTNVGKTFNLMRFRKFFSSVCGKIYQHSLIGTIRFSTQLSVAEDAVFLFELSSRIRSMTLSNETCIYFRNVREGSSSRKKVSPKDSLGQYFKKVYFFSKIYFSSPTKYNILFFLNRILAISKILILDLYTFLFQKGK